MTSFKSAEICKIIETCGASGVQEISLGDLKITFKGLQTPDFLTEDKQEPNNGTRSVPFDTPHEVYLDEDDELSNLMLSDPLAYEEMVKAE